MMAKKKRGHYCKACGRNRPNEKFTGKGHRQHLCKDCKRQGRKPYNPSASDYDREVTDLSKSIKNCMIVFMEETGFFLFQYKNDRYITTDDFDSGIFIYQANTVEKFRLADFSQKNHDALQEVLHKKHYETMENGHVVDYEEVAENETLDISKKRQQYLEVILSIDHYLFKI